MKLLLIAGLMVISSVALAKNCKIGATVSTGGKCEYFSTRFEVDSAEDCKALAKSTKENKFFNVLDAKEEVLQAKYKFKVKKPKKIKASGKIDFISEEDREDICW